MTLRLADHDFNERDLIGRVMRTAKPVKHKHAGTPRWGWVSKTFTVGSSVAYALCREFQLDPEERVRN